MEQQLEIFSLGWQETRFFKITFFDFFKNVSYQKFWLRSFVLWNYYDFLNSHLTVFQILGSSRIFRGPPKFNHLRDHKTAWRKRLKICILPFVTIVQSRILMINFSNLLIRKNVTMHKQLYLRRAFLDALKLKRRLWLEYWLHKLS